jgi:hypothetical protein
VIIELYSDQARPQHLDTWLGGPQPQTGDTINVGIHNPSRWRTWKVVRRHWSGPDKIRLYLQPVNLDPDNHALSDQVVPASILRDPAVILSGQKHDRQHQLKLLAPPNNGDTA